MLTAQKNTNFNKSTIIQVQNIVNVTAQNAVRKYMRIHINIQAGLDLHGGYAFRKWCEYQKCIQNWLVGLVWVRKKNWKILMVLTGYYREELLEMG